MDQLRKCFGSCLNCTLFSRSNKINPSDKPNEISFVDETISNDCNFKLNEKIVVETQPKCTQTSPVQIKALNSFTRDSSFSSNNLNFIPKVILLGSRDVGKLI